MIDGRLSRELSTLIDQNCTRSARSNIDTKEFH